MLIIKHARTKLNVCKMIFLLKTFVVLSFQFFDLFFFAVIFVRCIIDTDEIKRKHYQTDDTKNY